MKSFRKIGMALFAVLLSVNFMSCDEEDNLTGGGFIVSGRRLIKIDQWKDSGKKGTILFDYDDKGRLTGVTETEEYGERTDVTTYQYVWGDEAVRGIVNWTNGGYNSTFNLSKGLIRTEDYVGRWSEGTYTYSYNSSKRLTKYSGDDWQLSYIWDGDKVVSMSEGDVDVVVTYNESCKQGYFPLLSMIMQMEEPLFIAHPEIAGMRTQQLPATQNISNRVATFTYEFDKDGYVTTVAVRNESQTESFSLTWE